MSRLDGESCLLAVPGGVFGELFGQAQETQACFLDGCGFGRRLRRCSFSVKWLYHSVASSSGIGIA